MFKKTLLMVGTTAALGLSAFAAQASDRWSVQVGIAGHPVSAVIGFGHPSPVYYVPPPPVYVAPRVVYRQPVFVAPPVVYYDPPYSYRGRWDRWERWSHQPPKRHPKHRH